MSGLKEDMNKNNKKYIELIDNLNKYQKEIEKLREENYKLKQNSQFNQNINNNNQNIENGLILKLNNLIKENSLLKNS